MVPAPAGGGGGANEGELGEGVRCTFGRPTSFKSATSQELLGGTPSQARDFRKERE